MARQSRLYASGYAQLVSIQFTSPAQQALQPPLNQHYRDLMRWLGQSAPANQALIHGWSITPRCILLLATPKHDKSLPGLVQSLGRKFAPHLKFGSVFSGRYHSMIPQPNRWILPALIWLEHQPVREMLVHDAEAWPWSSAPIHSGATNQSPQWLQPHPDYWQCGNTPFDRQANYRQRLVEGLPASSALHITNFLKGQWALGEDSFIFELQKVATRRVTPNARGRPKKT
jgi:putative transposase